MLQFDHLCHNKRIQSIFLHHNNELSQQRLEITFGVSGTALVWFKSYLSNRHQAVVIKGKKSSDHLLKHGVPQGSVLGPVLFTLYTQPLVQEIVKFNLKYHFYADDTQLYDSLQCTNFEDVCHRMECCIKCVKKWMNENRLGLNDNKTEVLLTGSAGSLSKLERSSIHIGDSDIKFSNKVKNLGIHFDSDLASSSHVNALIRTMYLELRKIGKIRHLINKDCATLLVSSLVLSKLDYCNSLLAGLPSEKLKKNSKQFRITQHVSFKKIKTRLPNTSIRDHALASS